MLFSIWNFRLIQNQRIKEDFEHTEKYAWIND